MKLFVLLVAVLCLAPLALAAQREVRSYSSDMEYVDRVDVDLTSANLPVAAKEASSALVETAAAQEAGHTEAQQGGMRFLMESEAPEGAMDAWAATDSFVETGAEAEAAMAVNTDVLRALALEVHDAAHAALDAGEAVDIALVESDSQPADDGLTPAERAQAAADAAADAADAAAEAKDKAEEKKDAVERKVDKVELAQIKQIEAKVAAPVREKTIIQLPSVGAVSRAHLRTLRVNAAASASVRGALGELSGILAAKDDTIRSLVYNVTWSAVQMGKMADVIDRQRAALAAMQRKLHIAQAKVAQMHEHVATSASATSAIRKQLLAVEQRLSAQDRHTARLSHFIQRAQRADRRAGPVPHVDTDDTIVLRPRQEVRQRFARRLQHLRKPRRYSTPAFPHVRVPPPVATVMVGAEPAAPAVFTSGFYSPATAAPYQIPTIVVEAPDNLL